MMMIEDDDYNESIESIIDTQQINAEYAVAVTADNFAEMFASMDDAYMQARAADVKDISNRIIANLTGTISDVPARMKRSLSVLKIWRPAKQYRSIRTRCWHLSQLTAHPTPTQQSSPEA